MTKLNSYLIVATALVAACGGDDGGDAEPGMVNQQSATGSVTQTTAVNTQMAASMAPAVSAAVQQMTAANQNLVSPSSPRELVEILSRIEFPKDRLSSLAPAPTGTATCTPTMCTFENYGDDNPQNTIKIDGTISKSGDTLTFDLTYDIVQAATTYKWDISGSVTVTATSLSGSIRSVSDIMTSGTTAKIDIDVDYQDIVLDGQGCAIGGSVNAVSSYDVMAGGQTVQGSNVQGSATFGPACGTVTPS